MPSLRLRSRVHALNKVLYTFLNMLHLLIRTQPWYLFTLILLQCVQGLIPLFAAWTTKGLLDLWRIASSKDSTRLTPYPHWYSYWQFRLAFCCWAR